MLDPMLIKPRLYLLIIAASLGWLMAIASLMIGLAGLFGGHAGYALAGLGVFGLLWLIRHYAERYRPQIQAFLDERSTAD